MRLCISAFRNRKDGRSKECKQKIFAAQTPQRKRGYEEDFTLKSVNAYRNKQRLQKLKNSRFALSLKLCCEIAARQARGYGVLYEIKPFRHKYYSLYSHAVNRTYFSDQLAYGKMTFTNVSFLFRWCGVKIRFCFAGAK